MSAVIFTALISVSSFSDGLISDYKSELKKNDQLFLKLQKSYQPLENTGGYKDLKLNKTFLKSILLYTPKRFLQLALKDRCSFYDLILSNNLKSKNGKIEQFLVERKNNSSKYDIGFMSRKDFIEIVIKAECPDSIKFAQYFILKNLDQTLKKFRFKTPKNKAECSDIREEIIKDHKTPYFCYLNEEIKKISKLEQKVLLTPTSDYKKLEVLKRQLQKAKSIASKFNPNAKNYLKNMCNNLDKKDLFCKNFFTDSFYRKISNKQESNLYVKNICLELFNRFTKGVLETCINKIINTPEVCININKYDLTLLPRPNCSEASRALNRSRLNVNYNDCPGKINNETIVNISRILRHYSKYPINDKCYLNSSEAYAQYQINKNGEEFWEKKVCFIDKIKNKEVCYPTVFGDTKSKELSISENIKTILSRTRGFSKNSKCNFIQEKEYKPIFLKFQSGCHILMKDSSCLKDCDPQIILDQEKVNFITFKNSFNSPYFASSYLNESKSQNKLLIKNFKLKSRPIVNTTVLLEHYKKFPKSLLHGMACAEAIYPLLFSMNALNKCTPISFIIDGFIEEKERVSLIFRSSIDALHAPRIIPWSRLFNGIRMFQKGHPLNKWGLYALYN